MTIVLTNVTSMDIVVEAMVGMHQPLITLGLPEYSSVLLTTYSINGIATDAERMTIMAADNGASHDFTIPFSATMSKTTAFLITDVKFKEIGGYAMDYYRYALNLIQIVPTYSPARRPLIGTSWKQYHFDDTASDKGKSVGSDVDVFLWSVPFP